MKLLEKFCQTRGPGPPSEAPLSLIAHPWPWCCFTRCYREAFAVGLLLLLLHEEALCSTVTVTPSFARFIPYREHRAAIIRNYQECFQLHCFAGEQRKKGQFVFQKESVCSCAPAEIFEF